MLFNLLNPFRRWALVLCIFLGTACIAAVVGARLPDAEVCVAAYDYSTTQPGKYSNGIYDTSRGQYTKETRVPNFASYIRSPNQTYFVMFKAVRDETDLYDVYLQSKNFMLPPRLLQSSIWIRSGSLEGIGDRFRWSRDSKRIAYLWSDRDRNVYLTSVNVDDNQTRTVMLFQNDPSKIFYSFVQEWSADNHYFTVIEQELNDTYYSFWDSTTLEKVSYPLSTTSMVRGVWSPQGHSFAAVLRDDHQKPTDLMIFNPETSKTVIKAPLPPVNIQHLMWSPDGSALVFGYLDCKAANCQQQWYYDLFRASGELIGADLMGTFQNTTSTISSTFYGPEGRTTVSGYNFDATWSNDGKKFVYLEQKRGTDNQVYSLKAVDLAQGQTEVITTHAVVPSVNSFFHMSDNLFPNNRVLEGIPYLPQSDQVIMPYSDGDKVNIDLISGSDNQPVNLVRGADQIELQMTPYGQRQYWVTNMQDTVTIMIRWSAGKGAEKRYKLTTADSDGRNIQTFEDDWSAIDNLSFVANADKAMMGFIGKKDRQFNLYAINIATGELTLVLEDVQDSNNWTISLNAQQTLMAVNAGSSTVGKGTLYIQSMTDGSLIEIDPDAYLNVTWSTDGEKLAFTSGTKEGKQHFHIVSKTGTSISDHVVSYDSTHLFIPMRWSKCY